MKGVGPFLHIDADDLPDRIFATRNDVNDCQFTPDADGAERQAVARRPGCPRPAAGEDHRPGDGRLRRRLALDQQPRGLGQQHYPANRRRGSRLRHGGRPQGRHNRLARPRRHRHPLLRRGRDRANVRRHRRNRQGLLDDRILRGRPGGARRFLPRLGRGRRVPFRHEPRRQLLDSFHRLSQRRSARQRHPSPGLLQWKQRRGGPGSRSSSRIITCNSSPRHSMPARSFASPPARWKTK